jgi:hypothetical protein
MYLPDTLQPRLLLRPWPVAVRSVHGLRARPWATSLALFGLAYIGYLAVGAIIVFGAGSVPIDTWARVGNASYALFSRDPHLAAIGFVLPPIPTLAILPLLPFKIVWPALVTSAFAGPITSAAFMAGAVVFLRRIFVELGVPTGLMWVLVALFALHPMIVYYGANGLTEAPFVFCLLWATWSFLRWLHRGDVADLVRLGVALAIGYLTRYEFIAAAPLAVAVVATVTFLGTAGPRAERRAAAAADAVVVGVPFVIAFVGWAVVGWILVGSPFSQFTSVYGNSAQVRLLHDTLIVQTGQGTSMGFGYVAGQVLGLAPLLPIIGLFALLRAGSRLDHRILAPVVIIGGPLGFSVIAFLLGSTVGYLRYEIAAIPLLVVLAGVLLADQPSGSRLSLGLSWIHASERMRAGMEKTRSQTARLVARVPSSAAMEGASWRARDLRHLMPGVLIAMAVAVSLPTGLATIRHPLLAREEADALRYVLGNDPPTTDPSYVLATHAAASRIAASIDSLDLPSGSVLLDVAHGNPIVLMSAHPDRFVITPDRDFERVVADPITFDVRYILVTNGALDAVNRAYPTLYATGAGFTTLVETYDEPGSAGWRLYRIDKSP